MDTQEEFAARAYAFLTLCKEKGWLNLPDPNMIDELLNQAPIETFYLGWAHIAQAMKSLES